MIQIKPIRLHQPKTIDIQTHRCQRRRKTIPLVCVIAIISEVLGIKRAARQTQAPVRASNLLLQEATFHALINNLTQRSKRSRSRVEIRRLDKHSSSHLISAFSASKRLLRRTNGQHLNHSRTNSNHSSYTTGTSCLTIRSNSYINTI